MIANVKLDESLTKRSMADRMRRLLQNEDFKVLKMRWLDIRIKLLEDGKKRPSEAQWNVLNGFDSAVMEPERWVRMDDASKNSEEENDD